VLRRVAQREEHTAEPCMTLAHALLPAGAPAVVLTSGASPGGSRTGCHARPVGSFFSRPERSTTEIDTGSACGVTVIPCRLMAMTLRLSDDQTEALRRRAEKEGRSMQQVALAALDDYLLRSEDDELTDRLADQGAQRFHDLLRRLGE
jgi:predicted transcriptional regulator